jgi:biotin transporter BioY
VGRSADATLTSGAAKRRPFGNLYVGMAAGIAVIHALGVVGLYVSGAVPSLGRAVRLGVLPFLWFDLLKAYIAVLVAVRVRGALIADIGTGVKCTALHSPLQPLRGP